MAVTRGTEAYDLSLFEERPAKVVKLEANKRLQKGKAAQRSHPVGNEYDSNPLYCGFG